MRNSYKPEWTPALERRYRNTMRFLKDSVPPPAQVLDLGPTNPLSDLMSAEGYSVSNTAVDLDLTPEVVGETAAEVATAFEILEHLVAPFNVLRLLPCKKLIATVPLRLWFATAYRSETDVWDRHFHEFEDWQFDWLLEKSGWTVVRREKWTSPVRRLGLRPILRSVTKRYYAVAAVRSSQTAYEEWR